MKTAGNREYRRGDGGRFAPGTAPGPGRNRKQRRDPKLEKHALEVAKERIERMTAQALDVLEAGLAAEDPNDRMAAARLVLQKSVPDERHKGHAVPLPELAQAVTLSEKVRVVDVALAQGRVSAEQAKLLLSAIRDSAEIQDLEAAASVVRLLRRGKSLADAVRMVDSLGPQAALEHDMPRLDG
jgi:hypothetical protein